MNILFLPLALLLLLLTGCQTRLRPPDLGGIYARAAQAHDLDRNPVIVIPGILGSRLVEDDTGTIVWGAFGGGAADPGNARGARLVALPLVDDHGALAPSRDGVRSDGALDRVRLTLLGLPIELDAYLQILGTLGVGGYRDEQLGEAGAIDYGDDHYTCFQFDYDWRRDNVENARRLHAFILEKGAYVRAERERRYGADAPDVRFDIVAHSMGGLITRYMLRYGDADLGPDGAPPPLTWAGAALVENVILVGTPNGGSAEALEQLVEGAPIGPFLPTYPPAVLGTMPSIYQLLPRPASGAVVSAEDGAPVDILDPDVWVEHGWGLADPGERRVVAWLLPQEADEDVRRTRALAHQRACLARARGFFAALDAPASPPAGTTLSLVAGDAVPTLARLTVSVDGTLREAREAPGDGTVTRASALKDERTDGRWQRTIVSPIDWASVTFLFDDHLGLTKSPAFADNVLFRLLEAPR